tara:strand:- start:640 stop:1155 length:516 start_codon:yes stop_codon:yes gene_type:complete
MNKSIFSINSLSKYSELFQIVGVIGLIASLIFVGMELRQSQQIALVEQQQERVHLVVGMQQRWAENGLDFIDWLENGVNNENREFVISLKNSFWNIYDLDYQLYRKGYRDETQFLIKLNNGMIRNWNGRNREECTIAKRIWERRKAGIHPDLREIVEKLPNTCESLMSEKN